MEMNEVESQALEGTIGVGSVEIVNVHLAVCLQSSHAMNGVLAASDNMKAFFF